MNRDILAVIQENMDSFSKGAEADRQLHSGVL